MLEVDMTYAVDDVGALEVLHALANRNQVKLLLVSHNKVQPSCVASIASINYWYAHPNLPIGGHDGA